MIEMRDKVKDEISGFEGIVVGKSEYLNGCVRFMVQAKLVKEGKILDAEWIDEQQLKVTKKARRGTVPDKLPGGPRSKPKMVMSAPKH